MSSSASDNELAQQTAALCLLLGEGRHEVRDLPQVLEAAERARELLVAEADPEEVGAAMRAVDHALRQAGEARGLLGRSRSPVARLHPPGMRQTVKVAVCPFRLRCDRRERARDLLPAPACAVNGGRMVKEQLFPGP